MDGYVKGGIIETSIDGKKAVVELVSLVYVCVVPAREINASDIS